MNLAPPFRLLPPRGKSGATLLMTLGILTVLSVLVVSYLTVARLQRQNAVSRQNRLIARNYIDAALFQAMRQVESSFLTVEDFYEDSLPQQEPLTYTRLAPINHWFTEDYAKRLRISKDYTFQATGALASPVLSNATSTVNLLTPQVLSLIPSPLTNGLILRATSSSDKPFRSGWIPESMLPDNVAMDERLRDRPARIAFAVFDCSGFVDANTFPGGPVTQKTQRLFFNQADVTNWLARADINSGPFKPLSDVLDLTNPGESPFSFLSYDPNPNMYPLHYDCFETCSGIGHNSFGAGPVIDLNIPQMYQTLQGLKERATYYKFNINSLTNHLPENAEETEGAEASSPWFNDEAFKIGWLDPAVFLLEMMGHEEIGGVGLKWRNAQHLAWSIANFMDADRFPQVSDFVESDLATRVPYAVEDVPLISKVSVFNLFDPEQPGEISDDVPNDIRDKDGLKYYFENQETAGLSNHYGVAVELWYPFVTNAPPPGTSCYVGIFTNAEDVVTTEVRPWTASELRDWFRWNSGESNTVMQTLFYAWADTYTYAVGSALDGHPLWTVVTNQSGLWFTPDMTAHPSWPEADTNGVFSITNTAIWQAFYPETYDVVTTNASDGTVTTNVFTYMTQTNSYVDWISGDATNRLTGQLNFTNAYPYPVLLWTNLTAGGTVTNALGALIDPEDNLFVFYSPGDPAETNYLHEIMASPDTGITVVFSNGLTGVISSSNAVGFALSPLPPTGDGPYPFQGETNLLITTEILPVRPLPMPESLGVSLAMLFSMLPSDTLDNLYTFLMLMPEEFDFDYLSNIFAVNPLAPGVLLPAHNQPSLGFMTAADRHVLWNKDNRSPTVLPVDDNSQQLEAKSFQGYFWTVYPKTPVSFRNIEFYTMNTGMGGEGSPDVIEARTNYYALGSMMAGKKNTIWLRPVVTIDKESKERLAEDATDGDIIVDEALLADTSTPEDVPVFGWTSVTNVFAPNPLNNAYYTAWTCFPHNRHWNDGGGAESEEASIRNLNLHTNVFEMPFVHFNAPFRSIGDIGHVFTEYDHAEEPSDANRHNTVTFATRSGAALLDMFTVTPHNGPVRGLVQANTQHRSVIKTLLSGVSVGWSNLTAVGEMDFAHWKPLTLQKGQGQVDWGDVYADALTNAPYSMGWRSYADMLPNLSTNELLRTRETSVWSGIDRHSMHDYTEDVMRGLIDKVSFRQNIFVIVVAAQALSPASSEKHPLVLSDQRAAVTVIRDAYTGRWAVHNWIWLTD